MQLHGDETCALPFGNFSVNISRRRGGRFPLDKGDIWRIAGSDLLDFLFFGTAPF